jgi:hypothetical protein
MSVECFTYDCLVCWFLQPCLELQGFIERKAELRMRHKVSLKPHVVVLCCTVSDLQSV